MNRYRIYLKTIIHIEENVISKIENVFELMKGSIFNWLRKNMG